MKMYFKYLYKHIFAILTVLIMAFFTPLVTIDIINNQTAYYQASFTVSDISIFEEELLLDANFLNSIKADITPPIDIVKGMDMTVPGIIAHEAAKKGGIWLDVPRITD
jgi:hypothetical protein